MPIPTQIDMFGIILKLMPGGEERGGSRAKDDVAASYSLTEKDLAEKTSA